MKLYVDNDVIIKLASADLLSDFLTVFTIKPDDVFILPSAEYYFKRSRSISQRYDEATILRATQFARSATLVDAGVSLIDTVDESEVALLSKIPDIDSGEALLFAATHGQLDFLLASGDKRAVVAIAEARSCKRIVKRLSGKVLSFEQVVVQLIEKAGFERVAQAVVSAKYCSDKTMKLVFSPQQGNSEVLVLGGLKSYIEDLRMKVDPLLRE